MLCVLDGGIAFYSVPSGASTRNADFCHDRDTELIETTSLDLDDCVYIFYTHLLGHLTRSILDILNIPVLYGDYGKLTVYHHNKIPPHAGSKILSPAG